MGGYILGLLIAQLASFKFVILKLVLAALVGVLLGLEREAKHKPLGLKTCTIISIISCLLTIVSIESAYNLFDAYLNISTDPMRLTAQIISGVGFIGAGVILRRNNDVISGLTTAAIVWAASGFGIAIGAGYYFETIIGLTLMFAVINFVPMIFMKIGPRSLRERELKIYIYISFDADVRETLNEISKKINHINDIQIKSRRENVRLEFYCTIAQGTDNLINQYEALRKTNDVEQIEIYSL